MRDPKQCTPSPGTAGAARPAPPVRTPASAFAPAFLEKLRLLSRRVDDEDGEHATEAEAMLSGPLAVEAVETPGGFRYAVVRASEPVAAGGKVAALFRRREDALRAAAVIPAAAAPTPYRLKDKPKRLGYPLHDHGRHVGHLCQMGGPRSGRLRETLLGHLHVARYLAANPHALALLLESVGPEALPVLGRVLARRIEEALP